MLNQLDLAVAIDEYERKTIEAVTAARKLAMPEPTIIEFLSSTLSEEEIERIVSKVPHPAYKDRKAKKAGFLYIFRQKDDCVVARSDVLAAILRARDGGRNLTQAGAKNLCAVNKESKAGKVLYVGRSWDPKGRIAGHLRAASGKTYAIHFAAWSAQTDISVELFVYEFVGIEDVALQVIEDGVWDKLRPLLGRRGEK